MNTSYENFVALQARNEELESECRGLRGRVADLETQLRETQQNGYRLAHKSDTLAAEIDALVAQRDAARALLPEPLADGVMVWPAPASEVIESIRAALSGAVPVPEPESRWVIENRSDYDRQ